MTTQNFSLRTVNHPLTSWRHTCSLKPNLSIYTIRRKSSLKTLSSSKIGKRLIKKDLLQNKRNTLNLFEICQLIKTHNSFRNTLPDRQLDRETPNKIFQISKVWERERSRFWCLIPLFKTKVMMLFNLKWRPLICMINWILKIFKNCGKNWLIKSL